MFSPSPKLGAKSPPKGKRQNLQQHAEFIGDRNNRRATLTAWAVRSLWFVSEDERLRSPSVSLECRWILPELLRNLPSSINRCRWRRPRWRQTAALCGAAMIPLTSTKQTSISFREVFYRWRSLRGSKMNEQKIDWMSEQRTLINACTRHSDASRSYLLA